MRYPPCGCGGGIRLGQRQPSVLEKSAAEPPSSSTPPGRSASAIQRRLLGLEIADLPTERRLSCVQSLLGCGSWLPVSAMATK